MIIFVHYHWSFKLTNILLQQILPNGHVLSYLTTATSLQMTKVLLISRTKMTIMTSVMTSQDYVTSNGSSIAVTQPPSWDANPLNPYIPLYVSLYPWRRNHIYWIGTLVGNSCLELFRNLRLLKDNTAVIQGHLDLTTRSRMTKIPKTIRKTIKCRQVIMNSSSDIKLDVNTELLYHFYEPKVASVGSAVKSILKI